MLKKVLLAAAASALLSMPAVADNGTGFYQPDPAPAPEIGAGLAGLVLVGGAVYFIRRRRA